jgi:hypothetical protein
MVGKLSNTHSFGGDYVGLPQYKHELATQIREHIMNIING